MNTTARATLIQMKLLFMLFMMDVTVSILVKQYKLIPNAQGKLVRISTHVVYAIIIQMRTLFGLKVAPGIIRGVNCKSGGKGEELSNKNTKSKVSTITSSNDNVKKTLETLKY